MYGTRSADLRHVRRPEKAAQNRPQKSAKKAAGKIGQKVGLKSRPKNNSSFHPESIAKKRIRR